MTRHTLHALLLAAPMMTAAINCHAAPASQEHARLPEAAEKVAGLDQNTLSSLLQAEIERSQGQYQSAAQRYLDVAKQRHSITLLNHAAEIAEDANDRNISNDIGNEWINTHSDGDPTRDTPSPAIASAVLNTYAQKGEWQKALQIALWLDKQGRTPALDALTDNAMEAGADPKAFATTLDSYIKAHPDHPLPQIARALTSVYEGQPQRALQSIKRIEKKWPDQASAWLAESQIQLRMKQVKPALAAAQHGHKLAPQDPRYLMASTQLQLQLKQYSAAEKSARQLLASTGNDRQIRNQLGRLFLSFQQAKSAEHLLAPNAGMSPPDGDALLLMGAAAEQQHNADIAIARYRSIPANSMAFMPSRVRITQLLSQEKGQQAALDFLGEERKHSPSQFLPLLQLSMALLEQNGQQSKADALLDQEIRTEEPNNDDLLMLRAYRNIDRKDAVAVERDMKVMLKRHPDDPEVLNTYGYTLTELTDRYSEAFAMLKHAHELAPDNAAIMDSLGWTYVKLKQPAKALPLLEGAYTQDQEDEIAAHMASVLIMLNQREKAQQIVERGLKQLAEHPLLDALVKQTPWLGHSSSPKTAPSPEQGDTSR